MINANTMWNELKELSIYTQETKEQLPSIDQVKPLIDSASYLIRQVEICDNELSKINALPLLFRERMKDEVRDWNRQKTQYLRSLKQVITQL
jgi:hypothetical protein